MSNPKVVLVIGGTGAQGVPVVKGSKADPNKQRSANRGQ